MDSNTILTIIVFAELFIAIAIIGHAEWVTRERKDHQGQQNHG